jgi:ribonuclease P/MRP protein subunit POP5
MKRPAILPPTLRPKARYIAYHVISTGKVTFPDVTAAIWRSALNFLGELGASAAQMRILKDSWDETRQIGLLRCSHLAVERVRAALALVQHIADAPAIVHVLGISGTIRSAKKKFFGEVDIESFV